jgi:flagellar assembly protein FliH
VAVRTTEAALRSGGKAGRTAAELARLRDEAETKGYEAGLERGLQEGIERGVALAHQQAHEEALQMHALVLAQFKSDLESVVAGIQEAMGRWCDGAEEQMTDLVSDIARTVLVSELSLSRDSITSIVREALLQVTHSRQARIRVNPFDVESLREAKQELMACASSLRELEFVEDPAIVGGCVIETEGGVVDATLDTKLASLDEEIDAA